MGSGITNRIPRDQNQEPCNSRDRQIFAVINYKNARRSRPTSEMNFQPSVKISLYIKFIQRCKTSVNGRGGGGGWVTALTNAV